MQDHRAASPRIGLARVGIGLAAGLAVWALTEASDDRVWPATQPALLGALAMIAMFVPFVLLGGLGALRARTLAIWAVSSGVILALLGAYDLTRGFDGFDGGGDPWVSIELMGFSAAGLFIAHHLVEGAHAEHQFIARYPRYFETAWKHGVQLALSVAFVGVFWIVLFLGGALFDLIGIDAINELLRKRWFAFPATGAMFAAAVHLTDVRAGLIRGIRTVALTLLSWLLPVLVLLAGAFLLALPFTGLDPLWKTRSAASILLSAAAVLIVLINAAYQDGEPDSAVPLVMRIAGRTGGLLLVPMVALAAYALCLRIGQHGLTPDRIVGAACVIAGGVYAIGYAAAAIRLGRWMRWVEKTNITAAFVNLALLLAIFSPLADPAKLSVNDQMARLAAGKVKPEAFDYDFLRWQSGRYGAEALKVLKAKGGEAGRLATDALADQNRYDQEAAAEAAAEPAAMGERAALAAAWPKGKSLPDSFFAKAWEVGFQQRLRCTTQTPCPVAFLDLNADGQDELIIGGIADSKEALIFTQSDAPEWRLILSADTEGCPGFTDAIRAGRARAEVNPWRDLVVDGKHLEFSDFRDDCRLETPPRAPPMKKKASRIRPMVY